MRKAIIVGNWKMHTTLREVRELAVALKRGLTNVFDVEIGVCPPFVYILDVCDALAGSSIFVGAQDVHWEEKGAFTGEVSATMLRDVGCSHVIVGHSERRHIMKETDEMVNKKIKAVLKVNLTPILCVGETLNEREQGKAQEVVEGQLCTAYSGLSSESMEKLIIAYEPVWAIGTGKTATPQQAQEMHSFIRNLLRKIGSPGLAESTRIQYGGSIRLDNIKDLMSQPDVDGGLVGGASLDASSFINIIKNCGRP